MQVRCQDRHKHLRWRDFQKLLTTYIRELLLHLRCLPGCWLRVEIQVVVGSKLLWFELNGCRFESRCCKLLLGHLSKVNLTQAMKDSPLLSQKNFS